MPRILVLVIVILLPGLSLASVGFQQTSIPDPEGRPIAVGVWYPSSAPASPHPLALFSQTVAPDGKMSGTRLPLGLVSHGAFGSLASHYDTAIALAEAGFVAVALTHTGDNSNDQSYIGKRIDLIDRPRQVKLVLDWILSSWQGRAALDPERIGLFGFSLGGFTSLVEAGGTPELNRTIRLCSTHPDAPECEFDRTNHGDGLDPNPPSPAWTHDTRIKAMVIAAPAVSFLFGPGDLKNVTIPVQLWRAEKDSQAPDEWNSAIVRRELPKSPQEHVVAGQDHYIFLAPCSEALAKAVPSICHDTPDFDRTAFHAEFNRGIVAFLKEQLSVH